MRLETLEPGRGGRIVKVDGVGPEVQRLSEMGLVAGERLRVIRRAPFGDPLEVEIMGYLLTVRRREARLVEVEADA